MFVLSPRRSKGSGAVLALVIIATLGAFPGNVSSGATATINHVVGVETYQEFQIAVQPGETIDIDVVVQSGPEVGFYFVDQIGFERFKSVWPADIGGFTEYDADLSATKASSIHRSEPAPSEGIYFLVIANSDPLLNATVVGSIRSANQFPAGALPVVVMAIAIIMVVAAAIAFVMTRSIRAKAQQYVPPGQPTPQGQTHQHAAASLKPVVQQDIGRTCPKCGAVVSRGASTCPKCGAHL